MTINTRPADVDENVTTTYDKEALFLIPNVNELTSVKGNNVGEVSKFITRNELPIATDLINAESLCATYGGEPFPLPLDWVEGEDYTLFLKK